MSVIEGELLDATGDETRSRRVESWKMRIQGWPPYEIAEHFKVSVQTTYADLRWAQENLSSAIDSAEELRRLSLERLDKQYQQLATLRARAEEIGDGPHRTSVYIMDMQAKLLGAYAPSKVDGSVVVKYVLENISEEEDV